MASSDLEKQLANLSPAKRALLERKRRESSAAPVLRRIEDRSATRLSFSQQRFWLIHQLDLNSYLYNVPRLVRLSGKLDRAALEASLNEIIRRHEALRTTFRMQNAHPVQVIAPELRIQLPAEQVAPKNGTSPLDSAIDLALETYRLPFDLAGGPVVRARLWKLGEQDHLLLIIVHHIVSDGWSGGVLFDELGKLYEAFATGEPSPLPELPAQYVDFSVWQREWLDRVLDKQLDYWKAQLADAPPTLDLPTDHPRPQNANFRGHLRSLVLERELSEKIIAFAHAQGTTLFPVMLAALQTLMYRWTGQSDLVLGTVSANRNTAELEKLIGCFLNFLPLRGRLEASESSIALLEKAKKTALNAFAHQDCPFEKVVEAVNPDRAANVNPIYNVALLVQNYPAFAFRGDQIEARFLPLDTNVAFLDLRFIATESAGNITLECEANADLFDASTVDLLLAGYRDVLDQVVSEPGRTLGNLRIPHALLEQAQAHSAQTIALTATFTAEPVQPPLDFWMRRLGIPAKIKFAPFNQIFQQLLDPSSLLARNKYGINVILLRVEDLMASEASEGALDEQQLQASENEFVKALRSAAQRSNAPYMICICPPSSGVSNRPDSSGICERVQSSLSSQLTGIKGVSLITASELLQLYPVEKYTDEYAWRVGHIPYSTPFFNALATMIARRICVLRNAPYQVIVADCDQTLWNSAELASKKVGEPYRAVQEFLIAQQQSGKILCLVGTNSKESVESALASGMPIESQHIADMRIDDSPISAKLRQIADEFGLDPSAFIFVSSNPDDCAEVRANFSDVTVAQLPSGPEQVPHFLSHFWAFDFGLASVAKIQSTFKNHFTDIATRLSTVEAITRSIESTETRRISAQMQYQPPRNPTEELLAGMWSRLLRVDRPGIHDNFFALGGHSLLAVQLIARVRESWNVEMPLRAMFDAPTIARFAQLLIEARNASNKSPVPPLKPAAREGAIPLSYAQQRLWFITQLEPGNSLYNISAMYRMGGRLDLGALQKTMNEIVRRHESLRTIFRNDEGQAVQVILPKLELPLPVTVRTGLSPEAREDEIKRFAHEQARQPFDLTNGPLLCVSLLQLAEDEHVLVIILHHIVGDGWSGTLLAREMAVIYEAFTNDRPSPLPELTVQYSDFAIWQRQWIQGEVLDAKIAYWKKQLAGAPPVLELPIDRPRPAVQAHHGAIVTYTISQNLLDRLHELSQAEDATLFMTLLSAFQLLLSRYSWQEDIVVGSTVAGRNYSETESLIGFFINTLAMRTDLSGEPTFRELLARVRQTALDGYAHQEIPFEKVVEELQPERSLSYNPIFQVLFGLQNVPRASFEASRLKVQREAVHPGTSIFDMSWFAFETDEGLLLRVEYDTDLFEETTIVRWLGHFQKLLEAIVAHPESRIADLSLLSDEEQRRILVEFNDTARDYPADNRVHDFLAQQAEHIPDSVALISDNERITYRELNQRANQVAHFLLKHGAGPEVLVAIFSKRTTEMVVGILGILKAGSAYVPLDPAYPKDRLAHILEGAKAPIVLTQQSLLSELPTFAGQVICLDAEWDRIARESNDNPLTEVRPHHLAYVLFTSGSTGRPKGVAIEHHSAVTFIRWVNELLTPDELSGVLFCTSICFDMSTFEMFVTLCGGGKIILSENPLYLPTLPARTEVTLINTVPSAIAELIQMKALPDSVKTIVLAGEALPESLVEEIYNSTSVKKIYNMYGPTEVGYCTSTLVRRGEAVTIGKPLANVQAYILDSHLRPVPIGVPGEAYFAGEGVARGYYGRADLTQERFLPNPFSGKKNDRMYKTGDLCRWLPDGNIQYLGRRDHQIKIRGFRVEPAEIEAALEKHPAVRQSLVMVREDQPGLKRLVAYVVPQTGATPQKEDLQAHVKRSLPEFMVPASIVILDAFPLTPNGKINRKALPAPEYKRDETETYVAPRTPAEERIAAIWCEVLRVPQIGAYDDFFATGGHSLLAIQVISRIRQAFQVEISLRVIFESPSLAALAEQVEHALRGRRELELPPLRHVPRDQALPLSAAQQSLWFLEQLSPNSAEYNVPSTHRIDGKLDIDALQRSVDALVARHESLRTTFVAVQGSPVQVIAPTLQIQIEFVDFSNLTEAESELCGFERVVANSRRPFDLASGPLLRVIVVQLAGAAQLLSICIHHIISDRWSVGVLLRDLAELYTAEISGKAPSLPALPVHYADFATWQRAMAQGEAFQQQIAYWKEELKDVPPVLELPTDRPRPAMETSNGDMAPLALSRDLTEKLHTLSRAQGATLFMTLLAAFQALMSRYSGQDDFALGIPVASRRYPEIENLIGLFASTLPLRARLKSDPTFEQVLQRAKEGLLNANANQGVPFEKLVEELQPERSLSHSPLVQVHFILQNAPVENVQFGNLEMKHVRTSTGTSKGDLFFSLAEQDGALTGLMEYNTDLFDGRTIERMLGNFGVLLTAVAENPSLRLSELPLLTEAERRQMLRDWNATESDYPRDACLHHLFEQQAARTPEAVAIVMGGEQITYRSLDDRANQLANYLMQLGAGQESLVGIFLERSIDMVVALLAVLKTGSAYIPLDPAYPPDRIAFILEDASVELLLTQENLRTTLPEASRMVIAVDTMKPQIAACDVQSPRAKSGATSLAYVLYTSGSTGKPKGVQISHRNLVNFLISMQEVPGLVASDTLLAVTTLSFDIAGLEIYLPLITGGRIILASREEAADGKQLLKLMQLFGPTLMQATPATWRMLIEAGWSGSPTLKLLCGGEALPGDLAAQLLPRCCELWNMYGPTETTIWSSVYRVEAATATAPIGRPIANTTFYILDSHFQPVPIGATGELFIGGEGVARGYFRRPELTAEKFIPDPFDKRPGAKLYRTGDLVRFLASGDVQYLGRTDFQVKVRGFRIELGEIESVLAKHSAVLQAVAAVHEDSSGDKRLVGYIVPKLGQHLNIGDGRLYLKQFLPDYMIPSALVELETLPLTPNGKVNRKALPAPEIRRIESDIIFVVPRTPAEEIIASIWIEVLRLDQVSIHDNFFELGGHSLLGTQVISRVREAFGVDLPLRMLFETPTVAGLAEQIEHLRGQDSALAFAPLAPAQRNAKAPLSFAQQRLWFLDQLEPQNPLYNVPYIMRLQGPMKAGVLQESLNEILRRHESLRTRFEGSDGEPVQVIEAVEKLPFTTLDVSSLPPESRLGGARRLAMEEAKRPFDLLVAPLVRALLIKLADDDHALVINMHHIITDRWSFGVLSQELATLYEAFSQGKPSPLEPLPLQYADYAIWQRKHMTESWMQQQLAYWKEQLDGAPPVLELPTARPRRAAENFWGGICHRTLPESLGQELQASSRRNGATLFMTLLAGFQLLLARLSGQEDVVVGTDLANRTQLATEKLIGFFVNLLPIRTRVTGDPTFTQLLRRVKEVSLGAFAHQDVPFEKLVEELRPERNLTYHPLVQVLFVMQNTPRGPREFGGLKPGPLGVSSTSRFDLVLFINNPDEALLTTWMYNPNLFDESVIARMADLYETVLRAAASTPDIPLSRLDEALGEAEQKLRQSEQNSFHETSLRKLKGARRKAVTAPADGESRTE